ncbi:MAG: hypothetical protein JSS09_01240 [Verrucomicrobia bacterium]|nr:hypothetical protein [Verrucomicrobiota bacterium]
MEDVLQLANNLVERNNRDQAEYQRQLEARKILFRDKTLEAVRPLFQADLDRKELNKNSYQYHEFSYNFVPTDVVGLWDFVNSLQGLSYLSPTGRGYEWRNCATVAGTNQIRGYIYLVDRSLCQSRLEKSFERLKRSVDEVITQKIIEH